MEAAEPGAESDGAAAAAAPSSRRGPCGSCGAQSRYTCPGCGACSCSAACVAAHKAAAGCAGKRGRAAFVPLKSFDDATLRSDLRLLEETTLAAERARRARTGDAQLAQGLPRAALALQKARQTKRPPAAALRLTRARPAVAAGGARARHGAAVPGAGHGAARGQYQRHQAQKQGALALQCLDALRFRPAPTIRNARLPRHRPSCGTWSGCSPARPCARKVGLRRTFR